VIFGGRRVSTSSAALIATSIGVLGVVSPSLGDDPKDKKDSVESLTKIFLDTGAKREAREQALETALGLARNKQKPTHAQKFKPALISLLSGDLKSHLADKTYERFLALALDGMTVYDAPDPDISGLAGPFLAASAPDHVKVGAVQALQKFGTAGHIKALLAIADSYKQQEVVDPKGEPSAPPPPGGGVNGNKHREPLLRFMAQVAISDYTPTSEALTLLAEIIKQTQFPDARRDACHCVGEFATHRPPNEIHGAEIAKALLEACGEDEDHRLACAAAEALWRFGNPEGFNKLATRLDDRRKATREVYGAFCGAVHASQGFNNVPPSRWGEADPATKAKAIEQLKAAWAKAATSSPEGQLLEAIAAAGVSVPKDRSRENKEVITALIEGLALEPRDLRYGCLDLLAKRIPSRKDAIRLFKTLREESGNASTHLTVTQEEPAGGFQSQVMSEKLRAQQADRVKEWRKWWADFSPKAVMVDGCWTAPK
jgi:hypothetical protein